MKAKKKKDAGLDKCKPEDDDLDYIEVLGCVKSVIGDDELISLEELKKDGVAWTGFRNQLIKVYLGNKPVNNLTDADIETLNNAAFRDLAEPYAVKLVGAENAAGILTSMTTDEKNKEKTVSLAEIIVLFDKDNDGKLSLKTQEAHALGLESCDKNGNGELDYAEVKACLPESVVKDDLLTATELNKSGAELEAINSVAWDNFRGKVATRSLEKA